MDMPSSRSTLFNLKQKRKKAQAAHIPLKNWNAIKNASFAVSLTTAS
jgi:hypothetical protein